MIPIAKNIIVVDEQGNEYEATYPKRAHGLVKNGRARFIDENKICLACPPNILEDKTMSDKTTTPESAIELNDATNEALPENPQVDVGEIIREQLSDEKATSAKPEPSGFSLDWVTEQIGKIISDTQHIQQAMIQLAAMNTGGTSGDIGSANKAEAIGDVVKCRETTNQQALRLFEKMYDDLKPQKAFLPFESIKELAEDLPPEQKENVIRALAELPQNENSAPGAPLQQLKQILDELRSTDWNEIDFEIKNAVAEGIKAQLSRSW